MRDLTAPKHHGEANLVPLLQEPPSVPGLEVVVMIFDTRPELDLFDLDCVLLFPGLPRRSCLLVLEFPMVHQLDHRGAGIRCNFNQVQPRFRRPFAGLVNADDSHLFTIFGDQTNGADPDLVVDSDLLFFDGSEPPLSVSSAFGHGQ